MSTGKLYIDERVVAEGPVRTEAGKFTPSGRHERHGHPFTTPE
jgi:hypothetical protein